MQDNILRHLRNYNRPMKRKELLDVLNRYITHGSISDRKMRAVIESMIVDDGYLIESSDKGYNLITTDEQFRNALSYLDKKAAAIAVRKNCLIRNRNTQTAKLFEQ